MNVSNSSLGPGRRHFLRTGLFAAVALWAYPADLWAAGGEDAYMHVVRSGDTLSAIARRYRVSVKSLMDLNALRNDLLVPGQRLRIRATKVTRYASLAPVQRELGSIRVDRRRWTKIIVHHSATTVGSAKSFDANHRERGMENGLAYHFVVGNGKGAADGRVEVGPRWRRQLHGGHVRSLALNETSIGICFVGNFEKARPSTRQQAAVHELITYLTQDAVGDELKVSMHLDLESTLCPGRYFPAARFRTGEA